MQIVCSPSAPPQFLLQIRSKLAVSSQSLPESEKASPQIRLSISLCLLVGLFLVELGIGYWSYSLALIADAGHVVIDVAALLTTLISNWLAQSPHRYRWFTSPERLEAQAAFFNTCSLIVVAVTIAIEAIHRLQLGAVEILGLPMLGAAVAGLLINLINAFCLKSCSHHNLNLKSAFLHVIADVVSSVGVVLGAIAVTYWNWSWADGLTSLLVSVMILLFALPLLLKVSQQLFSLPTIQLAKPLQKSMTALQSCLANYCNCSEQHSIRTLNPLLSPSLEDLIR
ncbi:cation diffusion facilitator family transporter [Synechococcus elongatus]|uniref:cation diffusion facilitator family transporter n=1 Tax=Synechococcus elongatus TaxID=32046 RepID=UPI000F7F1569|nr:cation diffusion facilitator family transporter [Synechococcus elongatus]